MKKEAVHKSLGYPQGKKGKKVEKTGCAQSYPLYPQWTLDFSIVKKSCKDETGVL